MTTERFVRVDGEPWGPGDLAMEMFEEDSRGFVRKRRFFNHNGAPRARSNGWFGIEQGSDERGLLVEERGLGPAGESTIGKKGVAREITRYDASGDPIEYLNLDSQEKPRSGIYGTASTRLKYDRWGNVIETKFIDEDGNPTFSSPPGDPLSRASMVRYRYDDSGTLMETEFLASTGERVLGPGGFAIQRRKVDSKGHPVEIAHFGADALPGFGAEGFSSLRADYDPRGCIVRWRWFDPAGLPMLGPRGCFEIQAEPGEVCLLLALRCYDAKSHPMNGLDGHLVRAKYDGWGRTVEVSASDVEGRPVAYGGCAGRLRYLYSSPGGLSSEQSCAAPDGSPKQDEDGCIIKTRLYDSREDVVEEACRDSERRLAIRRQGYALKRIERDDRGDVVSVSFSDLEGRLRNGPEGYARARYTVNVGGRVLAASLLDAAGEPVREMAGAIEVRFKYDSRGRTIEDAWFDAGGQPMLNNRGHARVEREYDDRDTEFLVRYFDAAGTRIQRSPSH